MKFITALFILFHVFFVFPAPCDSWNGCQQCTSQNLCSVCSQAFTLVGGECKIVRNIGGGEFSFDGVGGLIHRSSISPIQIEEPFQEEDPLTVGEGENNNALNGQKVFIKLEIISIENCAFQIQNNCLLCESSFLLSNNSCKRKQRKCLELQQNNLCKICKSGLLLSSDGQCIDPNCVTSDFYECIQCAESFIKLPDGICGDPNCVKISESSFKCQECKSQFYTNSKGVCKTLSEIIPHCIEAINEKNKLICQSCDEKYQLKENECFPICQKQINEICIACREGYILGVKGYCLKIPNHCQKYEVYGDEIMCTGCSEEYILNESGICEKFNTVLPFCIQYFDRKCQKCTQGFVLDEQNGDCFEGFVNCIEYSGKLCTKCSLNHILSFDKKRCTSKEGCRLFRNTGLCLQCKSQYKLSNGRCIFVDPLCQQTNEISGECLVCYEGYELVSKRCIQKNSQNCLKFTAGLCTQCYDRYYLAENICQKVDDSCDLYFKSTGVCITCNPGYALKSGKCIKEGEDDENFIQRPDINCRKFSQLTGQCKNCYSSFYLSRNSCIQANPLCKTFNPLGGDCLSCFDGYFVKDGECIFGQAPEIQSQNTDKSRNCRDYDLQNNVCKECISRYYKSGGSCHPVSNNCNTYDSETGLCKTCYTGYVMRSGNCMLLSSIATSNCLIFDKNNPSLCRQCIDRYYLQGGVCRHVSILCNRYEKSTGKCIDCISGYLKIEEECKQPALGEDVNCVKYNALAFCEQCRQGYKLIEYKCQ